MSFVQMRKRLASLIPLIHGMVVVAMLFGLALGFIAFQAARVAKAAAVEDVIDAEIVGVVNGKLKVIIDKGRAQERIVEVPALTPINQEGKAVDLDLLKGSHFPLRMSRRDFQSEFSMIFYGMMAVSLVVGLLGYFVPSWLPLFPFERDRRFYERIAIVRFRNFVSNGELNRAVIASLDAKALLRFNRSTLQTHKQFYEWGERMHWAWFFATIPAFIWAIVLAEYGWVLVFCVANLIISVYPIMLERYMRARVAAMERHPKIQPGC